VDRGWELRWVKIFGVPPLDDWLPHLARGWRGDTLLEDLSYGQKKSLTHLSNLGTLVH
jgi:hypothetical protein